MWSGRFAPSLVKSDGLEGEHTNHPIATITDVQMGLITVTVFFNHTCNWPERDVWRKDENGEWYLDVVPAHSTTPPSNRIGYEFLYLWTNDDDQMDQLQETLDEAHRNGEVMKWLLDNIETGRVRLDEDQANPAYTQFRPKTKV